MMRIQASPARFLALLVTIAIVLSACALRSPVGRVRSDAARAAPILDGDISEWGDAAVLADEQYLYFRWTTGRADFPPQAAPYTTAILLDVDDNASTGLVRAVGGAVLGVDLEILLSPPGKERTQSGVRLTAVDSSGARTPIPHTQADFSFSPTYAANWFEGRLGRALPARPIDAAAIVGVYALQTPEGELLGESDPFRHTLPPRAAARSTQSIPARPSDAVRVVSFNVLKTGPTSRPELFQRILRALAPDIVLLQEWDEPGSIEPWFNTMLPESGPWSVRSGEGGVAIASRHALAGAGPDAVVIAPEGPEARAYRPVRVVTALAQTPIGGVLLASVHLKCCGTAGGVEDRTRLAEARAVNAAVHKGIDDDRVAHVVIAGDFNLVGSRPPLDLARAGLDADGTDLLIADARVLGDFAYYTWSDAASDFSPGRLDFMAFSDASATMATAFVLDTARLGPAALAAAGLRADDSAAASDHLPVVVDLRTR